MAESAGRPASPPKKTNKTSPGHRIVQAGFELPAGIEATEFAQPSEPQSAAPESTDPFAPEPEPAVDQPELFMPAETEAAPAPSEIVEEYVLAPTVDERFIYGQAQCEPTEEKGFMVRLHDRVQQWFWDQTYLFRIRNASQSRALHHHSFYEPVWPTHLPNYGHYQTHWRRFEENPAYCTPAEVIVPHDGYPTAVAPEAALHPIPHAIPVPPQPAPPAE